MKKGLLFFTFLLFGAHLSFGQWTYDNLSEAKAQMGSTSLGTKAYFAGGQDGLNTLAAVEIFDIATDSWDSIINLSAPRFFPSCVGVGNKVFFAGGWDLYSGTIFDNIDIWDPDTKQWSLEFLSEPRTFSAAVGKGNKVLFAGGVNPMLMTSYDVVDIYDMSTLTWTTASLSEARSSMAYAVNGDLAFFAGGINDLPGQVSDKVDIYRFSTNTWSTATLSVARGLVAAGAAGTKIFFAGGTKSDNTQSDRVDIYDTVTGIWTIDSISEARSFWQNNAAVVGENIYFVGGGTFDLASRSWSSASSTIDIWNGVFHIWDLDNLTESLVNHEVAGVDDHLIVAGGVIVPAWEPVSLVEIYHDPTVGIDFRPKEDALFRAYPNPSPGKFHLEMLDANLKTFTASICNLQGQRLYSHTLAAGDQEINVQLPDGIYLLTVQSGTVSQRELITISH
jgi:hypothetical protein